MKAKVVITSALGLDEFLRVSYNETAKEMWHILEITHEGTTEVKRARLGTLIHEYELFIMKPEESINYMQPQFIHIVSHMITLGKAFSNE